MSEPQLPREVRRRVAIIQHAEEVTGNVAMACRTTGSVDRSTTGGCGVTGSRVSTDCGICPGDRTTAPTPPMLTWSGKILYLRQNYHFGPGKIAMYLKRYHDVEVSQSGVWRILKRLDLNRLPASQRYKRLDKRWQRYEKQLPGHQVQVDVRGLDRCVDGSEPEPRTPVQ